MGGGWDWEPAGGLAMLARKLDQLEMIYWPFGSLLAGTVVAIVGTVTIGRDGRECGGNMREVEIYIVFTFIGPTLRNAASSTSSSLRSFFVFVVVVDNPVHRRNTEELSGGGVPVWAPTYCRTLRWLFCCRQTVFRRKACLPRFPMIYWILCTPATD